MKLYLLRHGKAEEYHSSGRDADRELTPEGVEEVRAEAKALVGLKLKLDLIVTSPYPRARLTAEIVAEALEMEDRLLVDDRLACGFQLGELQAIVAERAGIDRLMFVGHNPDLAVIGGQIAGGAAIDLKKGGLIRLNVHLVEPGGGILEWVLTPAVLIRSQGGPE
jgi:phosphohistidine phosphatase